MAAHVPDEDLRLPPFFPRAPNACRSEANAFFECFTSKSHYVAGGDAAVGRKALAACKDLLPAYEKCTSTHLTSRQKELVRAPQVYLQQVAASQT